VVPQLFEQFVTTSQNAAAVFRSARGLGLSIRQRRHLLSGAVRGPSTRAGVVDGAVLARLNRRRHVTGGIGR